MEEEKKEAYDSSDEEDDTPSHIIIDCGSSMVRAGFEKDSKPSIYMPNQVGIVKGSAGAGRVRILVGSETLYKSEKLFLSKPVQRGVIKEWDKIEKVFHYIFTDSADDSGKRSRVSSTASSASYASDSRRSSLTGLGSPFPGRGSGMGSSAVDMDGISLPSSASDSGLERTGSKSALMRAHHMSSLTLSGQIGDELETYNVVMTEPAVNPKRNREKSCEIMFETFSVSGFSLLSAPVVSLFSMGLTFGMILDIGHGVSQCVPVYEGYAISSGIRMLPVAGEDIDYYLTKALRMRYEGLLTGVSDSEKQITTHSIKSKCCYVATDFPGESAAFDANPSAFKQDYRLPDGHTIQIQSERLRAPEVLFNPTLCSRSRMAALKDKGLHKSVIGTLSGVPKEMRVQLLTEIYVAGGCSYLSGLEHRIKTEVQSLIAESTGHKPKVKVRSVKNRKYSAWLGATILSQTSHIDSCLVTKDEYDESGSSMVHRKCF